MNLSLFNTANLFEATTDLFRQLGIKLNSNTTEPLPVRDLLKQYYKDNEIFEAIDKTFFIGIIDDSVFHATGMFDETYSYKEALQQADKSYEGLMLFALELTKQPTRTESAELTRAFNRISQKMPVALVLKYKLKIENEEAISFTISERFKYKQNWRQGEKAGKVIILRDINTQTTHTGHLRILQDLVKPVAVTNYGQLHARWLQVLDVNILNKKFFQELANWYFYAMDNVQFPDDIEKKKEVRNATNLIRLITRIIFIWFIKEKKLVPANLFRKDFLVKTVKDFSIDIKSANYYQAILQNLFFGTLNKKMDERKFAESHKGFVKGDQGVRNIYRYADKFLINENGVKSLFKDVPFLNGGLFDCLDKTDEETKKEFFVDGFTRDEKHQAIVPDFLFFGEEQEVDLNGIYDTKNKKYKVKGLVNLLESYKFTVAENTPIEEEIALDPELLGKVFENLLASYNPETKTTARKQTGSFYTPREIVNYMVDESLLEYLKQNGNEKSPDYETRLRDLLSYSDNANPFNVKETQLLIEGINNCKILDPACGSGAFPMGVLHKMVHILTKLDNGNERWKELQRKKAIQETDVAYHIDDKGERKKRLDEIDDVFENNASDYGRKLYLIENCIYGIDIQPIAVQIAKLRFFISLIIDQNKKENDPDNFGIRSLPNLETKFVAANTLIGLEIPTTDLFSENDPIKPLQDELKNVRHLYFNAKNRKEKLQFQYRDKKLRRAMSEKIKTLLVKQNEDEIIQIQTDIKATKLVLQKIENEPEQVEIIETTNLFGEKEHKKINKKQEKLKSQNDIIKQLENKLKLKQIAFNKDKVLQVAENIASFDPYDQNHFANWFEPEWMFGKDLDNGFDVVIGNPPYINISNLKPDEYRLELRNKFRSAKNKSDTYAFFLEQGFKLLKTQGILSYIIPQTWKATDSFSKLREIIFKEKSISKIVDLDFGTFDAIVKPMVVVISNDFGKYNSIEVFNDSFEKISDIEISEILKDSTLSFNTTLNNEQKRVFQIIEKGSTTLEKIIQFSRGIKTSEDNRFIHTSAKNKDYKKVFRGKNVKAFQLNWNGEYVWYRPDLMKEKVGSVSYTKDFFEVQEKLVTQRVNSSMQLLCAYDDRGNYFLDTTNVSRYETWDKKTSLKYLCALLNSKVINYWYCNKYLMPTIGLYELHTIPIKKAKDENPFITIVDEIHLAKGKNPKADTSNLEQQLDEMVYKLYELTKDEIKIVEGK